MANYKETNISGTSYTRCSQVLIKNTLGQTPKVQFEEEKVLAVNSSSVVSGSGFIAIDFDPAKVINLVDVTTGEVTGTTITYGEVYGILYSAYLTAATERDALVTANQSI